ncbi:MAG: TldD/PmbA family protein [Myxococcota bacterium]
MSDIAQDPQRLLQFVLDAARRHGATAADALFISGRSTEVRVRLGETEQVKQSRDKGVGLRVFVGRRSATTSSGDLTPERLEDLVERTCAAAKLTAEDPHAGLPDAALFEDPVKEGLDLYDPAFEGLDVDRAIDMARRAEEAAQGADERIDNSEGGEMSWGVSELHFANSLGTHRTRRSSTGALWTVPVATEDGQMQRDHWFTSARHFEDLDEPEPVGREAARRALRRLGGRKPGTGRVPVVFEAPVASRMLGSLAGAVAGSSVYRKASWLCDRMGETIASPLVTITDDPHVRRGASSRPFDGEGLATHPLPVIEEGVLKSWLLDTYTGRKLGLDSTRHARRGLGGNPSPGPSNLWMGNGDRSLDDIISEIDQGLLITEVFGFGVNNVTGDYSQGAAGIWIEDGELAWPAHELTVASTLQDVWKNVDALADDRDPHRAVSAPSFRVASMTVAGS